MDVRIAVIQHGDLLDAHRIIDSGQAEPYFGMAYSLDVLRGLLDGVPHLVLSLDAPAYADRRGAGEWRGLPCPRAPRGIPRRFLSRLWAMRIRGAIRSFRPTHVLLRAGPPLAGPILDLCRRERYRTLVVFANSLADEGWRSRLRHRKLCDLLNDPVVSRVGNHKQPATQSVVDFGLDPRKAIAWDWPGQNEPGSHPPKMLGDAPFELLYAGTVSEAKGVGDLIEAARILHSRGVSFRLSVLGSGPDLPALRERAMSLPDGMVNFEGRVSNPEVFRRMRAATLLFVPSRHEFPEGMPMTLTEGLASRTPILASDHPVLVRAFRDGEGLQFFPAARPESLADLCQAVLRDRDAYRRLSLGTEDAYRRVRCDVTFGDLIDQWRRSFPG